MYTCKISGQNIELRDGFTITEQMDETLDSGTIQFLSNNGSFDIEPFDTVEISNSTNTLRIKLLVDTYDSEIEKFNSILENSDFFYTCNLFSETKILERITLPNLRIRQRKSGSPIRVIDKIQQYCLKYLPRANYYSASNDYAKEIKSILRYDKELISKFSMPCPEFSWTHPTLREVLTDLFMVGNCIPIVKENVLTYLDLNYRGNEIDVSKLTNMKISATSADYCDEITIPMENTITKTVTKVEMISLKSISSTELTTQNAVLVTQKPIYKIKSFKIYGVWHDFGVVASQPRLEGIELIGCGQRNVDLIVEKDEYNIKSSKTIMSGLDELTDYRCFHLYYTRGSNIIENVSESITYRTPPQFEATISRWVLAFASAINIRKYSKYTISDLWDRAQDYHGGTYDQRDLLVRIEYETIDESTLHVGKQNKIKNQGNRLFDGQTNPMVDLERQTLNEYIKVNRLGNKVVTIYGEYDSISEVPQLADTIGEKVLYSRSLTYYDNVIFFEGKLVDNYVVKDYYTGVVSKRRSWNIVDVKDAVVRHDTAKFYVTFSNMHQLMNLEQEYDDRWLGSTITGDYEFLFGCLFDPNYTILNKRWCNIKYAATMFECINDNKPDLNNQYLMDLNYYPIGRSVVYDFGFNDNAVACYRVIKDDSYYNLTYFYVDENGENIHENITLASSLQFGEGSFELQDRLSYLLNPLNFDTEEGQSAFNELIEYTHKKPIVPNGALEQQRHIEIQNLLFKDNAEIIKTTVQFELCSDNKDIIIYDELSKYMDFVYPSDNTVDDLSVKVYRLESGIYRPTDTTVKGVLDPNLHIGFRTYGRSANSRGYQYIYLTGNPQGLYVGWCLVVNGKMVLAVNDPEHRWTDTGITIEIRITNDNRVYNSQIDKEKIGFISESPSTLDPAYARKPPVINTFYVLGRGNVPISYTDDFYWTIP